MLKPLRQPHIASVSRDLSAPILAWRLKSTAAAPNVAKKASFIAAVDPRDEVAVPKPTNELESRPASAAAKGKKAPAKAKMTPAEQAAEAEAAKKTRGICTAFNKDVLEGTVVRRRVGGGCACCHVIMHRGSSTLVTSTTLLASLGTALPVVEASPRRMPER